ncbi:SRPBCC family protein [Nocardioides sp.]|uniref:SRPBCC family protein n=1 Tax=Nocardioides sp. TaxID=35761 RepID=UPI0035675340
MASPRVLKHSREFAASVPHAFDTVLNASLPDIFGRRYAAIAPVRQVRSQDGRWGDVGQTRTIAMSDGVRMQEELTSVHAPRQFTYEITGIKGLMRPLVAKAEGRWTFDRIGNGVRVTWQWTVHPRNGVAALGMPLLARMWHGYARQGMEELAKILR